jgi:D-tyrosyl-tRNA(Tyr) deacylase
VADKSEKLTVNPFGELIKNGIGGGHPKEVSITVTGRQIESLSQLSETTKQTLYIPLAE